MKNNRIVTMALGVAAMLVSGANSLRADVFTYLTAPPTISAGVATWTYGVYLAGQKMGTSGTETYFGTLYGFNFGAMSPAITSTTGLLSTHFDLAVTPSSSALTPALGQGPNDALYALVCSLCYNIRYTYDNSALIGTFGLGTFDLGTFTVKSSLTTEGVSGYDGQALVSVGLGGNSHPIEVAAAVPEPLSFMLFGTGLAALGLVRRLKR